MLSWRLWRVLHKPASGYSQRLIGEEKVNPKQDFILIFMIILWLVFCALSPIIFLPMTITLLLSALAIRTAWKVSSVVAQQIEFRRWELFSAMPEGAAGMLLEFCRVYSNISNVTAKDIFTAMLVFVGTAGGLWFFGGIMMSPISIITMPIPILAIVIVFFLLTLEYRQALVVGNIIGILAGSAGERTTARLSAVVGCIVVQVSCHWTAFILLMMFDLLSFRAINLSLYVLLLVAVVLIASPFILREVMLVCLWRWLRRRINDDLSVFTVTA